MGWSANHAKGLIHYSPHHSYRGYTLVTPSGGSQSLLIDMEGRICHRWNLPQGVGYSYMLDNGNLLLRNGGPKNLPPDAHPLQARSSQVVQEVDWEGNVVWEHRSPDMFPHHDFERLPNGNTLITEGAPGRFFEVTLNKEIVWEYVNPYMAPSGRGGGGGVSGQANSVFRVHRYGPDHPALQGKDLDPARYTNLNRLYVGG